MFRLENLFTWTEHVDLDRTGDDSEDIDAARVADDLDEISLSKKRKRKGGGLKLHLDLPPADIDDIPLGEGIKMPEWDFRRNELRKDFANVEMMQPRLQDAMELPEHLQPLAKKVRRQFEHLRAEPVAAPANPRQRAGLAGLCRLAGRAQVGKYPRAGPVHGRRRRHRDLSCLALADLSMSTDATSTMKSVSSTWSATA